MTKLRDQHCEVGTSTLVLLSKEEANRGLGLIDQDWQVAGHGKAIIRAFRFKNFHETMAFANAVAEIAHTENHHPEMQITYQRCQISYSTHDKGGLTNNDYICAAKIDALLE